MLEGMLEAGARRPGLAALMLALVLAELAWLVWRGRGGYDWRESAASGAIAAGNLLLRPLQALLLAPLFAAVHQQRLFDLRIDGPGDFLLLVIAMDFIYYLFHRSSHALRWMWATHAVHHSSTQLNLSAAYRLGWTSLLSGGWLFLLLPVWLGLPPAAVAAAFALNLGYQFFLHSQAIGRLGMLERVFNTPQHHRVHHACNEGLADRNFGGILIIWDRLFGSFAACEPEQVLRYGVAGRAPSHNPFVIALREWRALFAEVRRAPGLSAKLKALV